FIPLPQLHVGEAQHQCQKHRNAADHHDHKPSPDDGTGNFHDRLPPERTRRRITASSTSYSVRRSVRTSHPLQLTADGAPCSPSGSGGSGGSPDRSSGGLPCSSPSPDAKAP